MFTHHFSTRNLVMGVILAAILVSLLTLVVFGQTDTDKTNPTLEEELETGDRVALKSMIIPASAFVPVDDNMDYAYWGKGCVYRLGGTAYSEYSLQLPEGAVINYLRIYLYDKNTTLDADARLFAFDGFGNFNLIAYVMSSGTPGQSSKLSDEFTHVVDNDYDVLTLRLTYPATDDSVRICAVAVFYQYSLFGSFLPLFKK